jgi:hypothetical protein
MTDKPFWRHEMELPNSGDFDNLEDYEQAMNMYAHDRLYGLDDDRTAFEKEQEHELDLLYDEEEGYEDYTDRTCPECGGSGGDRWNDGVVPCKLCQGAGYID